MSSIEGLAEQNKEKMRFFNVSTRSSKMWKNPLVVLQIVYDETESLVDVIKEYNADRTNKQMGFPKKLVSSDYAHDFMEKLDKTSTKSITNNEIKRINFLAYQNDFTVRVYKNVDPKTKKTVCFAEFIGTNEKRINKTLEDINWVRTNELKYTSSWIAMTKIQKKYQNIFDKQGIEAKIISVHDKGHYETPEFQIKAKNNEELEKAKKIFMNSPEMEKLSKILTEKPNIVQQIQKPSPSRQSIAAEREH
jgi:hypothetical protein